MRGSWILYGSFIIVCLSLVAVGGWIVWIFCIWLIGVLPSSYKCFSPAISSDTSSSWFSSIYSDS